ncbi:MAG: J domain-containing protein [bacterium]|nr:J domain-containing protein [bacterium]
MFNDYYKLLNVDYTASNEEITRAYRKKLLIHHPDVSRDTANSLIHELVKAHKILTDSDERFQYNLELIRNYQKNNAGGFKKILHALLKG